ALLVVLIVLAAGGAASARVADRPSSARPSAGAHRQEAPGAVQITSSARLEQDVLWLINRERARRGLGSLRLNLQLAEAARAHSLSMAQHGFFGHESNDGASFARRMKVLYPLVPGHSWAVAENLMWAAPDLSARHTIDGWLRSPAHRRNLP